MLLNEGIGQWIALTAWEFEKTKMMAHIATNYFGKMPNSDWSHAKNKAVVRKPAKPEDYQSIYREFEVGSRGFHTPTYKYPNEVVVLVDGHKLIVNGIVQSGKITVDELGELLKRLATETQTTQEYELTPGETMHKYIYQVFQKYRDRTRTSFTWADDNYNSMSVGEGKSQIVIPISYTPSRVIIGNGKLAFELTDNMESCTDKLMALINANQAVSSRSIGSTIKKNIPECTKMSKDGSSFVMVIENDLDDMLKGVRVARGEHINNWSFNIYVSDIIHGIMMRPEFLKSMVQLESYLEESGQSISNIYVRGTDSVITVRTTNGNKKSFSELKELIKKELTPNRNEIESDMQSRHSCIKETLG
jgi:hypothetical protein